MRGTGSLKVCLILISLTSLSLTTKRAWGQYSGGSGTPDDPWQISCPNDLLYLGNHPADYESNFILTSDINLDGYIFTTAVIAPDMDNSNAGHDGAYFTGTFDGDGYVIHNLTIDTNGVGNDYLGLFGMTVFNDCRIINLGIEEFNITAGYDSDYLGGLVGDAYTGQFISCHAKGKVTAGDNSSHIGGLFGFTRGTLTNCFADVAITSGNNSQSIGGLVGSSQSGTFNGCYAIGAVNGIYSVGGLAGSFYYGIIRNCYCTASVTGGNDSDDLGGLVGLNEEAIIYNSYSTGVVSGGINSRNVGGLVGYHRGEIIYSYWDVNTSGLAESAGGEARSTIQMKDVNTFSNWSATPSVWTIDDGNDYPRLAWQQIPGMPVNSPLLSQFLIGQGTEIHPYEISNPDEFELIGQYLNQQKGFYFQLVSDLNLSGRIYTRAVIPLFSGVFDGAGFKIKNMTIDPASSMRHYFIGLFGAIDEDSEVKNLGIEDANVSGRDCRLNYLGGLAGYNTGIISQCYVTGELTAGENSFYIGGLAGYNDGGVINSCYSKATINSGPHSYDIGGLLGDNDIEMSRVGEVFGCYAAGAVNVGYSSGDIGGLVGENRYALISNCFWDTDTSGLLAGVGENWKGTITNLFGKTTSQMQTKSTFTSAGWDFTTPIWTIEDNDYPRLWWEENILYVPGHYPTIQAAIDAAIDVDTVVVAPGTYTGDGNRDIDFKGKAITVRSNDPNNPDIVAATIIDCQGTEEKPHRGFYFHNQEDSNSVLDGFTIINGWEQLGGGIYCVESSPTIKNCIIQNNYTNDEGGGIFLKSSKSIVDNCKILENQGNAKTGIECKWGTPTIINCVISNNISEQSIAGIYTYYSNAKIKSCLIENNYAYSNTGIRCYGRGTQVEIQDSTIRNNVAQTSHAGIFIFECGAVINNCEIIGNEAVNNYGGGIVLSSGVDKYDLNSILIKNCTISNNKANTQGGGLVCYNGSRTQLINCIIWGNQAPSSSEILLMSTMYDPYPILSISFSDIRQDIGCIGVQEGSIVWDTGNINLEPSFVNPEQNNYHLLPDSPCIDAGDPCLPWELEPWPNGARVNMGAYGNTPEATRSRDGLQFAGFNIIEKNRIDRTTFRYVISLSLTNITEDDMTDVYVEIIDASSQVINVIDDEIFYPLIEANNTVDSSSFEDYFIIEVDRSELITPGRLTWQVDYTRTDSSQMQMMSAAVPIEVISDISGDGEVDFEDLSRLINKWLWMGQAGEIAEDIFADGIVNFKDFAEIAGGWRN